MKTDELYLGQELYLPAWWTKPTQRILCRIVEITLPGAYAGCENGSLTVLPLTGNPHSRWFASSQLQRIAQPPKQEIPLRDEFEVKLATEIRDRMTGYIDGAIAHFRDIGRRTDAEIMALLAPSIRMRDELSDRLLRTQDKK